MIRKMKSNETLTSPTKLRELAEAATKALTVDTGIGASTSSRDLAEELARSTPKNITFATLPVIDNPAEMVKAHGRRSTGQGDAALLHDRRTTLAHRGQEEEAGRQGASRPRCSRGRRAAAADVRVDVYNGGGPRARPSPPSTGCRTAGRAESTNKGNAPAKVGQDDAGVRAEPGRPGPHSSPI